MHPTNRSPKHTTEPVGSAISLILVVGLLLAAFGYGPDLVKRIFPKPTPTPTPVPSPSPTPPLTLEELISYELKKLSEGQIVFNPPTTMKQGQPERVEARISSQELGPKLVEGLKGKGHPQIENIRVANVMKVKLLSDNDEFSISNLSSEEQIVSSRDYAQWEWNVLPKSFGEHSLHLTATAHINLERFGEKSIDIPVIDKKINVRINPVYIAKNMLSYLGYWPYIFGGLGLPALAAALWRFLSKKKRKKVGF